jgi:hypothetical protein
MSSTSAPTPALRTTPPSTACFDLTTPPKDAATAAGSLQVKDTPFVIKQAGKNAYLSTNAPKAEIRDSAMIDEIKGHFVGPVTPDEFFELLPAGKEDFVFDESKAKVFENKMKDAANKIESNMYAPFVCVFYLFYPSAF